MALQDTLGTVGDPITRAMGAVYSRKPTETQTPEQGMQNRIARGAIAEEQLPGLMEAQRAEAEKSQEEIAAKRTGMATRSKEIGDVFAKQEREIAESPEYRQKEIPAFEPSAANLEDIRNVLGLSIVAGFLTGGASKRSGMAAMAALNGAVEGFRQGRQDVYKRELDVFTKNIDAIKENNRQTLERFNRAMSLLQTDRKAAEGELKVLEAELQNSVAAAAMRQGMFKQASEAFYKAVEGSDRASQTVLQMKQQAELARERMQMQKQIADQNAQLRRDLAEQKRQEGSLKPGADAVKKFVSDNVLVADINDLVTDIQSPTLKQKIQNTRPLEWASEKSEVLNQMVQSERDPEVRQFMTKIIRLRNKYYHNQSGTAVSFSEAMRNYGAVPQPGDTPEAIDEKLKIMSKGVQDTIDIYRQIYTGLPAIQFRPGMDTGVAKGDKINPYAIAAPTIVQPQVTPSSGWDDAKEQRLQELRAKQRGAQSGTQ
jgi:tetratricopeptide (TPR) repeat protein